MNTEKNEKKVYQAGLATRVIRETASSSGEVGMETFHQEQGILFLNDSITFETSNQLMMNLLYTSKISTHMGFCQFVPMTLCYDIIIAY